MYGRRADASAGNDEVVAITHAAHRLHDVLLIVGNDLDPLQLDAQREAELGKVGRIGVDSLDEWPSTPSSRPVERHTGSYLPTKNLVADDQAGRRVDGLRVSG